MGARGIFCDSQSRCYRRLIVTFISKTQHADVVLIGGGIMSATLGAFIKQLEPNWTISLFERLDEPGLESSGPVEQRRHRTRRPV